MVDIKDQIRQRLGEPVVKVELTDEQLDWAINDALRWFNSHIGIYKRGALNVVEGVNQYKLPDEVVRVVAVYFIEPGYGGFLGGLSEIMLDFGWAPGLVPLPRGRVPSFGGVVLYLQKMETVWKIAAREPTWEFKDGYLYLYPTPSGSRVGVHYYDYIVRAVNFSDIQRPQDFDLCMRYAIASAKEILGRIRSKYSEFPAAEGGVSLDGDRLLAEAREEKERLENEIIEKNFAVPFIVG